MVVFMTDEMIERARKNGINQRALKSRLDTDWDPERAMTQPINEGLSKVPKAKSKVFTEEERQTLYKNRIPIVYALNRLNRYGWTMEQAITTPVGKRRKLDTVEK